MSIFNFPRLNEPTNLFTQQESTYLNQLLKTLRLNFDRIASGVFKDSIRVEGDIEATGFIAGKRIGTYGYLDAPTGSTVASGGTYYPILGTFNNAPLEGFGEAVTYTPGLRYLETKPTHLLVTFFGTLSSNEDVTTVRVGLKKNGVLVAGSSIPCFCKVSDEMYSLGGGVVVLSSVVEGDEIQLVVTADISGAVITFNSFNTTIMEFFN
jgi:hypothetical protein